MRGILKRSFSLILIFSLAFGAFSANTVTSQAATKTVKITGKYYQSDSRKMLKKINSFRTGKNAWYYNKSGKKVKLKNLKKLSYDYKLEKAEMKRAAEIKWTFSHPSPNGKDCVSLYSSGYSWCGENIAMGYPSVSSVMEGWKETNEDYYGQGHRRNMLNKNFTCVGIACFEVGGYKYWVQEFGSPKSSAKKTTACNKKKTVKITVKK